MAAASNYFQQVVNKLRIDPPAKFTGSEDYEAFFKRLRNYICMTDRNYGKIFDYISEHPKVAITDQLLSQIDGRLSLDAGTTAQMGDILHYMLSSLLEGSPYTILDGVTDGNGFEALRRVHSRYARSKQHKAILLLVKIVSTRFNDKDFESGFTTWESDITKFEEAIGKELYEEVKIGLLIAGTSGRLHEHLCLTCGEARDYETVRDTVINYVKHRSLGATQLPSGSKHYPSHGGAAPMDVGGFGHYSKGKSKGKGKSKKGQGHYDHGKSGSGSTTLTWTSKGKDTGKGKGKGGKWKRKEKRRRKRKRKEDWFLLL